MADLWARLPVAAQDAALALLWLVPGLLAGLLVLRGLGPWPLARALLWRFRGANAAFVGLMAVAVGLGCGLVAQERALRAGTARAARPFPLILGAPGSETTLVLSAVYLQPADLPLMPAGAWTAAAADPDAALVAPLAFGDSAAGLPVVGTTAPLIDHLGGLAEGRPFAAHEEAVAGALAPVALGDRLHGAHGVGEAADAHAHGDLAYTVVGRLGPTGTPWDRALLVPVETVWKVHGLPTGHAKDPGAVGPPFDAAALPGLPAIVVVPEAVAGAYALRARLGDDGIMAVFPGTVLAQLQGLMRDVREAMSLMAGAAQALVAAAVLVGLGLLLRVFARTLALLRALGAPARFVLAVTWAYAAGLVGLGAGLGLALGWAAAAVLSRVLSMRTGVAVAARIGWTEVRLVAAFASLALLLALLPAARAARRPPLDDLR